MFEVRNKARGRLTGRLNAQQVKTYKLPKDCDAIKLADGSRLYLQVTRGDYDNIRKSWLFLYEMDGVRHQMGLGAYPGDRSLREARQKAHELSLLIKDGINPLKRKQQEKAARVAEAAKQKTFAQCADAYVELHGDGWSDKHTERWHQTMRDHVLPVIGKLAPSEVTQALISKIIEPIWKELPTTAERTLHRIAQTLDFAASKGLRSGDNPARLVRLSLPKLSTFRKTENFASMPHDQVASFMAELKERGDDYLKPAAVALQFLVLNASRTAEVVGAMWSEVDLAAKTWVLPPERMKSGQEHIIPLSTKALAILNSLPHLDERIFPSVAEHHIRRLLRDMREGCTVHGFRSSFRQWAAALTDHPDVIAEKALAHQIGNAVEKAYRRKAEPMDRRRMMMEEWASYISTIARPAKVVPIRSRKKS
jgi:integrase